MIYMYMMIIRDVQTYPGAWALALMQPIYKGGGKIDTAGLGRREGGCGVED